jgi:hypothetical protein
MSKVTALAVFLAFSASCAFAGPAVPDPGIDMAAMKAVPQEVFDRVTAEITQQTSFQKVGPEGLVRWQPRTIQLVVFVKSPSHIHADAGLYAMRYAVAVLSEKETLVVHETSCQVVVVYKDGEYDDPTVVCEPLNLDRPSVDS